ncbi:MAG TPA: hypothetical protein VFU00_01710, partial [Gemmatimonadales bacterium]|nr:hypothetical protein [Gemmatimonadales bacterium]
MMSHIPIHGVVCGTMLFLAAAHAAEAQDPHTASRTSAVQRLVPDSAHAPDVTGRMRELVCRGKPGIDLRIQQDPSPRDPRLVAMVLRYERLKEVHALVQRGMGNFDAGRSLQFIPGSCTWGSGLPEVPPEPLVVYFDLPRDAQTHAGPGQRDTTARAAVSYPDVVSVPRYLSDSSRYWIFYVDDVSNVSTSFRARELVTPSTAGHVAGALREAAP